MTAKLSAFDRIRERATAAPLEVLVCLAPGYAQRVKRASDGWRGPCPLHAGANPNFALAKDGRWYCHSQCNEGGDILDLARRLSGHADSLEGWRAVLTQLAAHFGVDLGDRSPGRRAPRAARRQAMPRWASTSSPERPAGDAVAEPAALAAIRADGYTPATPMEIHTAVGHELSLGERGAAYLEARGLAPEDASSFGFRSLELRTDWAALEALLADTYIDDERTASGLATFTAGLTARAWLVIPYHTMDAGGWCGWRLRNLDPHADHKDRYRSLQGYSLPLPFNARALATSAECVLHICEGELNAYALSRYGVLAVGLAGAGTWRHEWTPLVHRAARVVLWFDDDAKGDKAASTLTDTLARDGWSAWVMQRVHRQRIPKRLDCKDLNDLHRRGTLAHYLDSNAWMR